MTLANELPRLLRAAYFGLHRLSDGHFASYGLTADQFVLLARLAEQDGITQQALARRACSDPSTIRAMLILLEGRGLVARERDPKDIRARLVTLTVKGRQVFQRLLRTSEPIRIQMLAGFSADETQALVDNLRHLVENLASANERRKRAKPVPASAYEIET